jgi:hypothetical protein
VRAFEDGPDLVERLLGGGFADLVPGARADAFGEGCSALDAASACASVLATTNLGPTKPAAIMLLTALPPPPPTPITTMRGRMSRGVDICASLIAGPQKPSRSHWPTRRR